MSYTPSAMNRFLSIATLVFASTLAEADVRVDAAYPGGNIVVESIGSDTVHLRQDFRDTKGWWFC
jgi:hypothetical protein